MRPRRVAFLYTELAGYFIACLRDFASRGNKVLVFHWRVNPEAPFEIPEISGVHFIERDGMPVDEINKKLDEFKAEAILCSGWIDKGYLSSLSGREEVQRVLLLDNQWTGSLKQRLKSLVFRSLLRNRFSRAWVPGRSQFEFAKKLGFPLENISQGFYSADITLFNRSYRESKEGNRPVFPKKFLYLGRYIEHKGIYELWTAFIEAVEETKNDWELVCVGAGADFEKRVHHEKIAHLGFKQPKELLRIIDDSGVFVLPSHFEPWGVVAHEMAAAGLPLLLSEKVGAASHFLVENENGFSFPPADRNALKRLFIRIMKTSDDELWKMSKKSHSIGQTLGPERWSETLLELL